MVPKEWCLEEDKLLKRLRELGHSFSKIADLLPGRTKNSCIGRALRLDIPKGTNDGRPRKTSHKRQPSKPIAKTRRSAPSFPPPLEESVPLPVVDLEKGQKITVLLLTSKTCRWPIDDPGTKDFCFCGHLPKTGSPYCDYHTGVAYHPSVRRTHARRLL